MTTVGNYQQLMTLFSYRPRLLTLESGAMDASIGNLSNIEEEPRTPNITLERSSSSAYKHTALTTSSSSPAYKPTALTLSVTKSPAVQSSKSPVKMNSLFPIVKSSKQQSVGVKTVGEASSYQSVASASAEPLGKWSVVSLKTPPSFAISYFRCSFVLLFISLHQSWMSALCALGWSPVTGSTLIWINACREKSERQPLRGMMLRVTYITHTHTHTHIINCQIITSNIILSQKGELPKIEAC